MAIKRPTSFITAPEDEQADYLAATNPTGPRYVAPDPNSPDNSQSNFTFSGGGAAPAAAAIIAPSSPAPSYVSSDPDTDPNAYVSAQPKSAQLRQEAADIAAQRPSKEPGFWRTLAGIGAGIGVGYLTRDRDMVHNVEDRIMHPGLANWTNKWNDKVAQAKEQEQIEADAAAAAKGQAGLALTAAQTRNQNSEAANRDLPGAPPSPEWDVTPAGVVYDKHGKTAPIVTPPPPKPPTNAFEARRAAYMRENNGQEPPLDVVNSWEKPVEPLKGIDYWNEVATAPPGKYKPEEVAQANKAIKLYTQQALDKRPERPVNESAQKNAAINRAFVDSGNDWNKVLDNVRAGKYPDYAGDIADHAQKMTALKPDAQRKVTAADTTLQQVQAAIDGIDEVTKAHPNLVGSVGGGHPINALTRFYETHMGTEPPDVGAVDATLETAAALQPGQHNFRSIGALAEFKKALGIDPRTGKADGSREWLRNPEKAKAALKSIADFNQRLKENTLNAAGNQGAHQSAPAPAADPLGIR